MPLFFGFELLIGHDHRGVGGIEAVASVAVDDEGDLVSLGHCQGDGVILSIKHNGKTVEIGNEKNGGLLITYGSPADGEITLTVAEGDEIAFIINRNGTNAFDATDTSVIVSYQ